MTSPDPSLHQINDYLNQHADLTHAEARVAYYTIHADYGQQKNGLFWEGAAAISQKVHVDRELIKSTWNKMCSKGWLRDTGKKVGRAIVWQIQYKQLRHEASQFKQRAMAEKTDLPRAVQELLGLVRSQPRSDAEPIALGCGLKPHSDAEPSRTTPPNYSAQFNQPNRMLQSVFLASEPAPPAPSPRTARRVEFGEKESEPEASSTRREDPIPSAPACSTSLDRAAAADLRRRLKAISRPVPRPWFGSSADREECD